MWKRLLGYFSKPKNLKFDELGHAWMEVSYCDWESYYRPERFTHPYHYRRWHQNRFGWWKKVDEWLHKYAPLS